MEPEENEWLTLDSIVPTYSLVSDNRKIIGNGSYKLFGLSLDIQMSDKKVEYERRSYTILDLLGDFGGFNGSLAMIFGFFLSYYSDWMYQATTSHEFSISSENLG